jgi:hypothetical protein
VIYKNYLKYDNKWENITVENVRKEEKRNLRRNFELIIQYRIKKSNNQRKNTLVEKYGVDNISKKKKNKKMIKLKKIVYMMVLSNSQVVKMRS